MKLIAFWALLLLSQVSAAETVSVKYHRAISLDSFACAEVNENSDVSRVCYDKAEKYMILRLKTTYYHYCEIDAATAQSFLAAGSKRKFFESKIRGSGADGPYDCRTHPIPKKYR